jgi:alkaline phosphatase D
MEQNVTHPPPLFTRRSLLGYTGSAATALLVGTGTLSASEAFTAAQPRRDPFTLGVASGDPRSDGVVLWTRAGA